MNIQMSTTIRPLLILAIVFFCGLSYLALHNAIQTISNPIFEINEYPDKPKLVPFNTEAWKAIIIQLLEKVRQGIQLSQEELELLRGMHQHLQGHAASQEEEAEELTLLIEMVFDFNNQLINQNPDEGQRRTDYDGVKPDGH